MTPDSQSGSCGFEPRRGTVSSGCRGVGHPAGFGNRRSQVRLLPARPCPKRGRGVGVLASLMSSRPWVRIPPAPSRSNGGVAQRKSTRLSSEPAPVRVRSSPLSWWLWCNGSIRGREPRGAGSNPVGRPMPFAGILSFAGDVAQTAERPPCKRPTRVRLPPSPCSPRPRRDHDTKRP